MALAINDDTYFDVEVSDYFCAYLLYLDVVDDRVASFGVDKQFLIDTCFAETILHRTLDEFVDEYNLNAKIKEIDFDFDENRVIELPSFLSEGETTLGEALKILSQKLNESEEPHFILDVFEVLI